jgi:hypothetical protein
MGKTGREGEIVRNFFVGFIVFFWLDVNLPFPRAKKTMDVP